MHSGARGINSYIHVTYIECAYKKPVVLGSGTDHYSFYAENHFECNGSCTRNIYAELEPDIVVAVAIYDKIHTYFSTWY